jgi:biotin carboxyl carrier protein
MRWHLVLILLKWLLGLGLLGGLLGGLYLAREQLQEDRDDQRKARGSETTQPKRDGSVGLEEDEAERYGLEVTAARTEQWYEPVTVYGRVVTNPRATSEVRSPFAGTLRTAGETSWPALGQRVQAGQTLGWVDVRVGPDVRFELQNKLTDARIRQRGAEEEVKLQQSRVDSLRKVTSQLQLQSRAELDAALIQLAQAKNQLATAAAAAELWQKALAELERHKGDQPSAWSQPLTAPADGEITDVTGRPGMSVEAGALVLEVVDSRRPLVRLDVPPEVLDHGGPPQRVEIQVPPSAASGLSGTLNSSANPSSSSRVEASLVGPAPRVHAALQFVSYWYDVRLPQSSSIIWRPGLQVMAVLRSAGASATPAVSVPASAVLYHEGRPLVYVRAGKEKYQRREVRLLGREGDRWILAVRQGEPPVGVAPEESVVSRQAQVLLSKEFLTASADED